MPIPRRHFLKSLLPLYFLTLSYPGTAQIEPESFTIIHLTDTHVCTLNGHDPVFAEARKHNEDGGELLRRFLLRVPRDQQADAVAITGDLIDFYATEPRPNEVREGQVERFAEVVKDCPVPLWLTLGNHDVGNLTINPATGKFQVSRHDAHKARAAWMRKFACFRDGTFYSIVRAVGKTRYRLIFLDNDYPLNTGESNYYADRFQIDWFDRQLQQAKGERVVLFTHLPLPVIEQGAEPAKSAGPCGWSSLPRIHREHFIGVLEKNPEVEAVFAGHRHQNVIEEVTLPSGRRITQIQTGYFQDGSDNWRVINLKADGIEVSMPGSSKPEKTIGIRSR